jgi:phosphodiesterase/alkaline phosphatase D-like protein
MTEARPTFTTTQTRSRPLLKMPTARTYHPLMYSLIRVNEFGVHSMTGTKQQKWFFEQMDKSSERGAIWRLVMQQVVFARVNYTIATQG